MSDGIFCPHGLDLRTNPRCYLCDPLAWPYRDALPPSTGCTCPSVWHAVIPPTCPVHNPATAREVTTTGTNTWSATCTCRTSAPCLIHNVTVSFGGST